MNQGSNKNRVAIVVGAVLVLLGLWQLAQHLFGTFFAGLWKILALVIGILGPLVIIAVGILVVVAAQRDKLSLPKNKKLYRSSSNKKIAGVCGGIAEYLALDYALVRIVTLVLAFICWYIVPLLYILLWIIVPLDTQKYNSWI